MALIKCKECGKEISSNAIYCPKCGMQVNETTSMEAEEKNITTILKYANILQIIELILGVVAFLFCFSEMWFIFLPIGIALIISSIIGPAMLVNKALVLKNLYEINREGKR